MRSVVGLSRSRVHQILSALDDADDWDDEEDNYPPPPPYFYVGTEPVVLTDKDMDHSTVVLEPRFLDVNMRSCSMLDIYRWCAYQEGDHGDYEGAARVRADVQRQLDAVGGR